MGPYGSQNCKTLLLPQIATKSFQTFPEFLSSVSSQSYFFKFLKFCIFQILWNFEIWHGSQWEIIKCGISWKRLIVEQNEWKFGTRGPRKCICRLLFRSGHLSSVWGHSVHFAKFPMLKFQKATAPTVFIQFQPNFMESMVIREEYRLLPFLAICQN